eukprot:gene21001-27860_t
MEGKLEHLTEQVVALRDETMLLRSNVDTITQYANRSGSEGTSIGDGGLLNKSGSPSNNYEVLLASHDEQLDWLMKLRKDDMQNQAATRLQVQKLVEENQCLKLELQLLTSRPWVGSPREDSGKAVRSGREPEQESGPWVGSPGEDAGGAVRSGREPEQESGPWAGSPGEDVGGVVRSGGGHSTDLQQEGLCGFNSHPGELSRDRITEEIPRGVLDSNQHKSLLASIPSVDPLMSSNPLVRSATSLPTKNLSSLPSDHQTLDPESFGAVAGTQHLLYPIPGPKQEPEPWVGSPESLEAVAGTQHLRRSPGPRQEPQPWVVSPEILEAVAGTQHLLCRSPGPRQESLPCVGSPESLEAVAGTQHLLCRSPRPKQESRPCVGSPESLEAEAGTQHLLCRIPGH